MDNPRSTASIAGHPIHPMLVPFPIAFFVAFVTGLLFWRTGLGVLVRRFVLASKRGPRDGRTRGRCWFDRCAQRATNQNASGWHAGGNVLAVLLSLYNWYARYASGEAVVVPRGLTLSLIVVLILLFTGWKGWKLVYLHRVGVSDKSSEAVKAAARVRVRG